MIKKLTGEEIIQHLVDNVEAGEFAWDDMEYDEILGQSNEIERICDYSSCHVVRYFTDHEVYIKLNGWYNSYESGEIYDENDYNVVKPIQKMVTFYE